MIQYSNKKAYNQIWSPMGRYPMIDNTIFETYLEAFTFATTNSVAVVGSIVSVTNDSDSEKNGVYQLIYNGDAALTNATQPTGLKKLGADINLDNYVTKDQITSVYTYKGSVVDHNALIAIENPEVGDVYNVEAAFDETSIVDETTIVKTYPAGTNWVWNGTSWDALAGAVDLTNYATKENLATLETSLEGQVSQIASDLATTNTALENKVEKVSGSSLISAEKLALIDTNAADIQALEDKNLDSRVSALEGMFKDGETNIDLSSITASISDHTSRISVLEGDNTTNKTNIETLQTQVQNHGERLTAIETLNTEQSTQISGLTTRVEAVEAHGTAITNLTTAVNGHTESISTLRTDLNNEISNRGTAINEAKTHAETKANEALDAAKEYANSLSVNYDSAGSAQEVAEDLAEHVNNVNIHVTKDQKDAWDAAKTAIDTFLKEAELDSEGKNVIDTLKELQTYVSNDGTAAGQMLQSITEAKNAADKAQEEVDALEVVVSGLEVSYKAADAATLESAQSYVEGKLELLGTASYKNVEEFATAAQGIKADAAAPQATTYTKTEVDNKITEAFAWINVE